MIDKNEYRLQDVILGLRPEYLNLANQLKKLNQCVEVSNQISRYGFQTLKNNDDIELCCLFERKLGWFRHLLAILVTNYPDDGFHHFVGYAHKEAGEWQISSEEEESYRLVNKEQFDATANSIFHNVFVQKSHSDFIDLNDQKQVYCSLGRITISEKSPLFVSSGELTYYSAEDCIEFSPSTNFSDIQAVLDTPIPKELLTPYQRTLIDQYLEKALPVCVDQNLKNGSTFYQIEEGPNVMLIKNLKFRKEKQPTVS